MSNRTKQIIVQLDDDRVLEYDSENSQFLLAERVITTETAIRYFVDYLQEPFNELFASKIDEICQLFQNNDGL